MTGDDVSTVVVDTSVVSSVFNQSSYARFYQERMVGRRAVVSFQTVEELYFGAYKRGWGSRRRSELDRHLQQYEVVWPTSELVRVCARLRSGREAVGRRLETADAWIAATAIMLNCPLASHDRDFSGIPNLELIQMSIA